ncbi:hypothetical protein IQ06DRAFT_288491 [Phaeosphaeriaceae sp. SRC1lsM3a]|nr:hypothetical protein IQ06DRAFT_288491 [Stagonospora sp. SRC1lsM3a]
MSLPLQPPSQELVQLSALSQGARASVACRFKNLRQSDLTIMNPFALSRHSVLLAGVQREPTRAQRDGLIKNCQRQTT